MATTTNSYQLSILHGCIVTTKTQQEASQLLWQQQSHKVAASLLPRICINQLYRKLCYYMCLSVLIVIQSENL